MCVIKIIYTFILIILAIPTTFLVMYFSQAFWYQPFIQDNPTGSQDAWFLILILVLVATTRFFIIKLIRGLKEAN